MGKSLNQDTEGENRSKVLTVITEWPGAHANEIVARTGIPKSTVMYHLFKLTKAGAIVSIKYRGSAHFFPSVGRKTAEEKTVLSALRHEGAREILRVLVVKGESSKAEIGRSLGSERSSSMWHIKPMEAQGVVRIEKRGRQRFCSLVNPQIVISGMKLLNIKPAI